MKQSKLLAGLMLITLVGSDALAGISNTKHNLTNTNNANRVTALGPVNEVCVFCHTPHASETSAPVPLWNKRIDATITYTTYSAINSNTLDGAMIAVGSVSVACLSCHDGTQAMDNIINAPGSQGYNSNGGSTAGLGWTWNVGARTDTDGKLLASNVANLSTDLKNDHPIGVEYCGGFVSGITCKDADFKAPTLIGTAGQSSARYYVEASANATKDKSDMQLYTRDFGANGWKPSVECGSCHDPHVEAKSTNEVAFLRVSQTLNAASGLCLSCHTK